MEHALNPLDVLPSSFVACRIALTQYLDSDPPGCHSVTGTYSFTVLIAGIPTIGAHLVSGYYVLGLLSILNSAKYDTRGEFLGGAKLNRTICD
jgi:hypothetical protein